MYVCMYIKDKQRTSVDVNGLIWCTLEIFLMIVQRYVYLDGVLCNVYSIISYSIYKYEISDG